VEELLPRLVKRLKLRWADAKTFCAVSRYLPEVLAEQERQRRRQEREQAEEQQGEEARRQTVRRTQDQAILKAVWDRLVPAEQEEIRSAVLARQPVSIKKFPPLIERFCLEELARRQGLSLGG